MPPEFLPRRLWRISRDHVDRDSLGQNADVGSLVTRLISVVAIARPSYLQRENPPVRVAAFPSQMRAVVLLVEFEAETLNMIDSLASSTTTWWTIFSSHKPAPAVMVSGRGLQHCRRVATRRLLRLVRVWVEPSRMSSFDRTYPSAGDRCKAVARPAAPLPMTKTSVEKRRVKKSLASYGSKPSLGSIYGLG
ncbi:MAG: hypothetical protein Ct9H300mP8_13060 [Gammaproteobacteria bacterium]|nr:MAG: hypothetical protein Ct9H300mP8_13060 [Gammaproteobacteria bacterium]